MPIEFIRLHDARKEKKRSKDEVVFGKILNLFDDTLASVKEYHTSRKRYEKRLKKYYTRKLKESRPSAGNPNPGTVVLTAATVSHI